MDEVHDCRVDILLNETGRYAEYTSRKKLVTETFGRSLMEHLKRSGSGCRLVRIVTGRNRSQRNEVVLEEAVTGQRPGTDAAWPKSR
jgi:hypothetical protein